MGKEIPLPIARLWRRSHNAKSPKDQHDAAYYGLEATVRLTAIAQSSPSASVFKSSPSLGDWVASLPVDRRRLENRAANRAATWLREVGQDLGAKSSNLRICDLFLALPAYRNRIVGHGAPRSDSFYRGGAEKLRDGLREVWEHRLLPVHSGQLVWVEAVTVQNSGEHLGRVLTLMGESPLLLSIDGSPVPTSVIAQRLYWKYEDQWSGLDPWAVYDDEAERVFFFNGLKRHAEYLDFGSGTILQGKALNKVSLGIEGRLRSLLVSGPPEPVVESRESSSSYGEFTILRRLGVGGMGEVHLARQESLGRLVALKTVRRVNDPVARARFRREIEALSRCEHANVIKILASGDEGEQPWYAMEYVDGVDFADLFTSVCAESSFERGWRAALERTRDSQTDSNADTPIQQPPKSEPRTSPTGSAHGLAADDFRRIARIFSGAAAGLAHIHEKDVLHRDLSPANLMLTRADERPVVMDLGLAFLNDASVQITVDSDEPFGTRRYLAPERLRIDRSIVGRRADIYSLGACLYEACCGQPLAIGDTREEIEYSILSAKLIPPQQLQRKMPRDLSVIIRKATERDPRLRYEDATQFEQDLAAFVEGRPISAQPPSLPYLARITWERNRALVTTIAAAIVLGAVGTVWFIERLGDEVERTERIADQLMNVATANEKLTVLQEQAKTLWPLEPGKVGDLERWLSEAEALQATYDSLIAYRKEVAEEAPAMPDGDRRLAEELKEAEVTYEKAYSRFEEGISMPSDLDVRAAMGRKLENDQLAKPEMIERAKESLEAHRQKIAWILRRVEAPTFRLRSDTVGLFNRKERELELRNLTLLINELQDFLEGPAADKRTWGIWGESLPEVRNRLELIKRLQRETLDSDSAQKAWTRYHSDMKTANEKAIESTFGLLPLRRDPKSGRWEFAHLLTGSAPKSDGEAGNWIVTPNMGVVLIQIKGEQGEPLLLAKYEMTQAQWRRVTGKNPSFYQNKTASLDLHSCCPVEMIAFSDSVHDASIQIALARILLSAPPKRTLERILYKLSEWPLGLMAYFIENLRDRSYGKYAGLSEQDPSLLPWDDGYALYAPVGSFPCDRDGFHDMYGNISEVTCTSPKGRGTIYYLSASFESIGGWWTKVRKESPFKRTEKDSTASSRGVRPCRSFNKIGSGGAM